MRALFHPLLRLAAAQPHTGSCRIGTPALRPSGGNGSGGLQVCGAMGLLDGKRILVTGVLTDASLAFGVASLAQEEGADVIISVAVRWLLLSQRSL
jgi:hypothetical protein